MKRKVYSTEDFNSIVSSANTWESVSHHLKEMMKYHPSAELLCNLKEEVSNELFKDGHYGAATHFNCLLERLLDELSNSKLEIEFLSKNLN